MLATYAIFARFRKRSQRAQSEVSQIQRIKNSIGTVSLALPLFLTAYIHDASSRYL